MPGYFFDCIRANIELARLIAIYQKIDRKETDVKRRKLALYIVACLDVVLITLSNTFGFSSAVCFYQAAAHTLTTQYGWYCMPRTDGLQPEKPFLGKRFPNLGVMGCLFFVNPEPRDRHPCHFQSNGNAG